MVTLEARVYLDLFVRPTVHTQGLHLGYVGAQLSVDRRASHAKKDTQLLRISALRSATWGLEGFLIVVDRARVAEGEKEEEHTLHDAQPVSM